MCSLAHTLYMSRSGQTQSTPNELSDASATFALPKSLREQVVDAAWARKITMGELLRRFTVDGLAKLAGDRPADGAHLPTSGADVNAHI